MHRSVDGQPVRACQTAIADIAGRNVVTIEGLPERSRRLFKRPGTNSMCRSAATASRASRGNDCPIEGKPKATDNDINDALSGKSAAAIPIIVFARRSTKPPSCWRREMNYFGLALSLGICRHRVVRSSSERQHSVRASSSVSPRRQMTRRGPKPGANPFVGYVQIAPDDTVTIYSSQMDMGQESITGSPRSFRKSSMPTGRKCPSSGGSETRRCMATFHLAGKFR